MTASRKNDPIMAGFLIERGADVNAKDRYGATVLAKAPGDCQAEIVILLKKAGATGRC
jgi:ankyrin repeat protein